MFRFNLIQGLYVNPKVEERYKAAAMKLQWQIWRQSTNLRGDFIPNAKIYNLGPDITNIQEHEALRPNLL